MGEGGNLPKVVVRSEEDPQTSSPNKTIKLLSAPCLPQSEEYRRTEVVISSLSPNATPYSPVEVSQKKEDVTEATPKVTLQKPSCDADLEASLKAEYLELNSILGASPSTSLDKHFKRISQIVTWTLLTM